MEPVPGPESTATPSPSLANLKRFQELFPGVVQDGVLDAGRLGEALGIDVSGLKDGKERFGLMWAGRQKAVEALQAPSYAALVPDKENSVNWDSAENVFIEGDNLEVLKLMQNAYNDQVKLIYIDPPYNTGNDFVYNDDFSDPKQHYLEVTGQVDAQGNRLVANTEVSGRKHSNWLTMMYPRLQLARNLLTHDGVICISIDDNEVHALKILLDEIFGSENFVCEMIWKSKSGGANDTKAVAVDHEYILIYARDLTNLSVNDDLEAEVTTSYSRSDENGDYGLERLDKQNLGYQKSLDFPIIGPDGETYSVKQKDPANPQARWRWSQTSVQDRYGELVFENGNVYTKNYRKDGAKPRSLLIDERFGRTRTGSTEIASLLGGPYFDNPKSTKLIGFLVRIFSSPGDVVLDFFAGSGTTGHAVHQNNLAGQAPRKYVLVTLNEDTDAKSYARAQGLKHISEVTKSRLIAVHRDDSGSGFRAFRLDASAFERHQQEASSDYLRIGTLAGHASRDQALSEVLLALGQPLHSRIKLIANNDSRLAVCNGVLVSVEGQFSEDLIEAARAEGVKTLALFEDDLTGLDALKANLYFACKKANITFKTF